MILPIVLISFYLEGILSKISFNFLTPLTTLMSLILIYPYLNDSKKEYYISCFSIGLLYDIGYTNTMFLNAFIFLLLGFFITKINIYIKNNSFNVILMSLIIIILYRLITYLILVFIDYLNFNINTLLNSIIYSLLLNFIYISILYKITDIISKKKGIIKKD